MEAPATESPAPSPVLHGPAPTPTTPKDAKKKNSRARKKSKVPTRIYTFGCRAPTAGGEEIVRQLELAALYWNMLVRIELERRAAARRAQSTAPDVAALQAREAVLKADLEAALLALRVARQAVRKRGGFVAETGRVKEMKAQLKAVREQVKGAKKIAREDPAIVDAMKAANEAAKEAGKRARAEITEKGLYWGTYLLVEAARDQARAGTMDMQYHRYTGEGRVGVQFQKTDNAVGIPAAKLFGDDRRMRIAPLPEGTYQKRRHHRRLASRTTVDIRVGSGPKGRPLFARLPVIMHRPFPDGAVIKGAWIRREKHRGVDFRYLLQMTVESRAFLPAPPTGRGRVAIDIGWRVLEGRDALRVAYMCDDQGNERELRLPPDVLRRLEHADSLRAIRDRRMDEARPKLQAFLRGQNPGGGLVVLPLPEWMPRDVSHWKSCQRLGDLVWRWKHERFAGDEEIFPVMEEFMVKDRHLCKWEADDRFRGANIRRDFYLKMAADIAGRYATVVIEEFDLRKMARRAAPEENKDAPLAARHNRHVAALSEFRNALAPACVVRSSEIERQPAMDTTMECHLCGYNVPWDAAPKIMHTCGGCGKTWDQDKNAAMNLLRKPPPASRTEETAVDAGSDGGASGDMTEAAGEPLAGS